MGGGPEAPKKAGVAELFVFVAAIVSGTACSICSKTMMELKGVGISGTEEVFTKPIFQTFGMFVGMLFGLVMHWVVLYFKIDFPGYHHKKEESTTSQNTSLPGSNYGSIVAETDPLVAKKEEEESAESDGLPVWMYWFLAIPAMFDLGATALCMMGLQYIDVSIYQLLRGSGIIFVALMKQHVLGDHLYSFQWVGVFFNVVSVFLVGGTAILNEHDQSESDDSKHGQALLGVLLVMCGAVVQAMQFVFEEKVMTMDIPAPPLLLIGMEGFWGTVLCIFVVYPLAYFLPGNDHGSYEDFWNTFYMFMNNGIIQKAFVIYFFAIFMYNFFAVLVTYMLNSIWHAILDNFRPITVWGTDMFIYYVITSSGDFGEPWTKWSWVQVGGMFVLLYGTGVYNAPNAGSVRLEGEWYSFGLNFSSEYKEIEDAHEEHLAQHEEDAEWQNKMKHFAIRKESSFYTDHSPHTSVHTQALHGLASSKV
eukprot:Nitzschia sp. Nitz4//scaffold4_size323378//121144//122799//NITZ4_000650-RA/size323378-snap-gene-0.416-mRNA-1//1//CDS//3329553369//8989//frame0